MEVLRPAAVAGFFYPGSAAALAGDVGRFVAAVPATDEPKPKAIVVPHAGYVYSGPVAAFAYARLAAAGERIRRVVLLGPAHRVAVRGLAVPEATAFATPLGDVEVDAEAVARALALPQVCVSASAHAQEHSLEVQLPFLQVVLGEFRVVPFVVGAATADEVAAVLDLLWGGPETLIVVSTDLSHYHRYDDARAIDRGTVEQVLALTPGLDHEQACGATPLNGLLLCARRRALVPELLDLRNSGDTAGDRARVVGYAAFAFAAGAAGPRRRGGGGPPHRAEAKVSDRELGGVLLRHARAAIAERLDAPARLPPVHAALADPGATFVTLTQRGELRGCIGSLEPRRRLDVDVRENAVAAAFLDPRFSPLRRHEFDAVVVEVSLLGRSEPLAFDDEAELLAQLLPGRDGLIIEHQGRRATFLPQVWDALPAPEDFLVALKRKAGLAADFRSPGLTARRYTVTKWTEAEFTFDEVRR
ncbi:MAG: AmmeMemoRadiSam system protein B [Betaproteobacteria bacterium]|nr:AmmeMemoRadiSam system protein B [Betaproteobacteria bacterium]